MNVTNRSVYLNIGDVYGTANSSLFCEDQHEAVQISDVEVLSPLGMYNSCLPLCILFFVLSDTAFPGNQILVKPGSYLIHFLYIGFNPGKSGSKPGYPGF